MRSPLCSELQKFPNSDGSDVSLQIQGKTTTKQCGMLEERSIHFDTSLPHLQSRERSPLFSDLSRRSLSEPAQSVAPVAQDKYGNLGHQRGSTGENSRRSTTNAARVVAPTEEMFVIQPWHGRRRWYRRSSKFFPNSFRSALGN